MNSSSPQTLARAVVFGAFVALVATPAVAQQEQQEEDPGAQEQQRMQEADRQEQSESLMAVAQNRSEISLFVQAVKRAGLQSELEQNGPYTVFAPTNDAFREHFDQEQLDRLLGSSRADRAGQQGDRERREGQADRPQQEQRDQAAQRDRTGDRPTREDSRELLRLVRSHIVSGEWSSEKLQNVGTLRDVLGGEVAVGSDGTQGRRTTGAEGREQEDEDQAEDRPSRERQTLDRGSDPGLQFGEAGVVETDLRASNGVIHVIDAVVETSDEPRQDETRDTDRPRRQQQERDTTRSDSVGTGG